MDRYPQHVLHTGLNPLIDDGDKSQGGYTVPRIYGDDNVYIVDDFGNYITDEENNLLIEG
jgi:hypothetical protein